MLPCLCCAGQPATAPPLGLYVHELSVYQRRIQCWSIAGASLVVSAEIEEVREDEGYPGFPAYAVLGSPTPPPHSGSMFTNPPKCKRCIQCWSIAGASLVVRAEIEEVREDEGHPGFLASDVLDSPALPQPSTSSPKGRKKKKKKRKKKKKKKEKMMMMMMMMKNNKK
eukprot:gene21176-28075_t